MAPELLEFLKPKDYLSSELIEQFEAMGGLTREGKTQEEIIIHAGFKQVLMRLVKPFNGYWMVL